MKKHVTDERENVRSMKLPVVLTDNEHRLRCAELGTVVGEGDEKGREIERATQDAKAIKERLTQELEVIALRTRLLGEAVRTKKEPRDVTVFDRKDYTAGEVQTVREDTGEIVSFRAMSEADRQRGLFADANAKKAGAKD